MVAGPLILGAGLGLGVWICVRALRPRPEPVAAILARLEQPGHAFAAPGAVPRPAARDQVGRLARRALAGIGLAEPSDSVFQLVGRSAERHALGKVAGALAGLLVPSLVALALTSAGLALPFWLAPLLSVGGAVAGWALPDLSLRDLAAQRRRAFRHALSAYLDLVNILLAGGAGIETALHAAAHAGDGWGFEKLRQALNRSRLTGQSPWDTFARLGEDLGISELSELAASVSLAGSHGARIRASLAAKADALRGHQVAEAESAAEAATERMTIPVTVMLAGFLVFIAYPALLEVTSVS